MSDIKMSDESELNALLCAFKSLMMQTPADTRRELINNMGREEEKNILLNWVDESCGDWHYELLDK